MNRSIKSVLSLILCAVLLFTTASVAFAAEDGRKVIDSGYCGAEGENLTWTLYEDGELVISGEGEMDWYYMGIKEKAKPTPWHNYYDMIYSIIVEEGVTSIGTDAFWNFDDAEDRYPNYYKIRLPKTIKYIDVSHHVKIRKGQHLAVCYNGGRGGLDYTVYYTDFILENGEVVGCERISRYNWHDTFDSDIAVYYNGEEPESFCYLSEDNGKNSFSLLYYSDVPNSEKLVWYVIRNGRERKFDEMPVGESHYNEIRIPRYTTGENYIRVELVDTNGNVIAESEERKLVNAPSVLDGVKGLIAYANFSALFFVPIILMPFAQIINYIKALFK